MTFASGRVGVPHGSASTMIICATAENVDGQFANRASTYQGYVPGGRSTLACGSVVVATITGEPCGTQMRYSIAPGTAVHTISAGDGTSPWSVVGKSSTGLRSLHPCGRVTVNVNFCERSGSHPGRM